MYTVDQMITNDFKRSISIFGRFIKSIKFENTPFAFLCLIYIAFVHYHWMLLTRAMFLMDLCGEYISSCVYG